VIRENTIGNEESKKELFEKQEVRVSYSDELENILRKAALEQRKSLVEDILFGEIEAVQAWVRKRAFDYMEQGVSKMGEDIDAAKKVIDEIKEVLQETNSLLGDARQEISRFIKGADFKERGTSETLVNVLKFLRSVGETAELDYKKSVADKV